MAAAHKRNGSKPSNEGQETAVLPVVSDADGYPYLCLRHLQPRFGIEELSERQRSEFLLKWAKRSQITWEAINTHSKHGLGFEMLPSAQFRPSVPEQFEQKKYHVFRHDGNLPFAGIKVGNAFYVLWIEKKYGELYKH